MHSSRSLEPMHPKQKFREGAAPVIKKRVHSTYESHDEQDHDSPETIPFWEQEEQTV